MEIEKILETIQNAAKMIAAPNCADIASVILSIVAVIVSSRVACKQTKISKKQAEISSIQNKIALFEKRMECYTTIQNLLVAADQIKNVHVNKGIQVAFRMYLGKAENIADHIRVSVFATQLKQKEVIIVSGEFLFSRYNTELLQKIINVGFALIMQTAIHNMESANAPLSPQAEQLKAEYCYLCEQYENTYLESMEKELQLI